MGTAIGSLITSLYIEKFGRKPMIIVSDMILIIGSLI